MTAMDHTYMGQWMSGLHWDVERSSWLDGNLDFYYEMLEAFEG